jgi:casein kinase 1/casein kinase I family protein HRR25
MDFRVGQRFRLGPRIGCGAFGDIYSGADIHTGAEVAIKLEPLKNEHLQLIHEANTYRILHGGYGIPSIEWFGSEGCFNVMVMDRLGQSLDELFEYCGKRFSLKTVLMLADQMLDRLEYIHSRSYIHRDIKPENFLIGRDSRKHICHIIDFGLAKEYQDPRTGTHIPYYEGTSLTGTARYASINSSLGREQSRRDDIESLGYVLLYFLRGSLPWQGLHAPTKAERYQRILETKQATSHDELCRGFPSEFKDYFVYCSNLGFEDSPDYTYLKRMFRDLYKRRCFDDDGIFDWDIIKNNQQVPPEYFSSEVDATADAVVASDSAGNDTGANTAPEPSAGPTDQQDNVPSTREAEEVENGESV